MITRLVSGGPSGVDRAALNDFGTKEVGHKENPLGEKASRRGRGA